MRTLIIGDIHGCIRELEEMINSFTPLPGDVIYSVGDVINKGGNPGKCIELLREFKVRTVMGNHELWFLKMFPLKSHHAGLETAEIIELEKHLEWIKKRPLYYEEENFIVLHAGVNPALPLHRNSTDTITSVRRLELSDGTLVPWFDLYRGPKHIYFGHWAKLGLYKGKHVTCLDSGCVYGNKLTGYVVEEERFIEIKAKKQYKKIIHK